MGMFDTFNFQSPLFCPYCGAKHTSVQSKKYECGLRTFSPGDEVELPGEEQNSLSRHELICFGHPQQTAYVYLLFLAGKYVGAFPDTWAAYAECEEDAVYFDDSI